MYLALKIGLTVSASIPIAVLSVAFFRTLGRSTILENNIVQTTGSAGESIAAGIVFTLPAILLMGYDLSIGKVAIVAVVGGVMGILLMIPLRRALIVKEHGRLTYPEGTACAEVLVAGEKGGLQARRLFQAFGIAFAYKFLMSGLKAWKEYPGLGVDRLQGRLHLRRGVARAAGRRLHHRAADRRLSLRRRLARVPGADPGDQAVRQRADQADLRRDQADRRHEPGRGARQLRVLHRRRRGGLGRHHRAHPRAAHDRRPRSAPASQDLRGSIGDTAARLRTDLDLPVWVTLVGAVALALLLTALPQLAVNLLGAILIVVFGFFFVVVSSRITGEIGVSANPVSGMTIAALIGTTAIFLLIGWTGVDHRVGAISIAGVIAVAASNAGATSQDLKTGFLVGATPRRQQIAIIVGAVTSALAVGWTLTLLNTTYTTIVPERHPGRPARGLGARTPPPARSRRWASGCSTTAASGKWCG